MAFKFPLDSILRLRRSQQRQQELALQRKSREVIRLRLQLADTQAEVSCISAMPLDKRTVAELQFDRERVAMLAIRRAQVDEVLQRAIADREAASAEFHQAWQRREMIETLRNHARDTYDMDEARRTERALDDWFLARKRHPHFAAK